MPPPSSWPAPPTTPSPHRATTTRRAHASLAERPDPQPRSPCGDNAADDGSCCGHHCLPGQRTAHPQRRPAASPAPRRAAHRRHLVVAPSGYRIAATAGGVCVAAAIVPHQPQRMRAPRHHADRALRFSRSRCRSPASIGPAGVAVDTAGNLYGTDSGNNRVLRLPAGSRTQTVLPFTGLNDPRGVAVDIAGMSTSPTWPTTEC